MQTTIRVDDDVVKMLDDIKSKENAKSYNDIIKNLLGQKKISMFGADKTLKKWKKSEDRAKFR
jgi:predicted CopG family antitoxin